MVTRMQRLLASLDALLLGWEVQTGSKKSGYEQNFYTGWGRRMAIVTKDGEVRVLGGSWWVVHHYDGQGNLLSRIRMRDTLKEGEQIIYGDRAVSDAYAKSRYSTPPSTEEINAMCET